MHNFGGVGRIYSIQGDVVKNGGGRDIFKIQGELAKRELENSGWVWTLDEAMLRSLPCYTQ